MTQAVCPSCSAPASGRFCRSCGASLAGQVCAKCGNGLDASDRFCPRCGASSAPAAGALGRNERIVWFLLGGGVTAVIGGLALALARGPAASPATPAVAQAPFAGGAGGAEAVDISNMTPKERFDRLYDRIMRAAESGDENTVTQFTPMALAAYGMLDSIDSDARYDAALLRLHTGDIDGAAALADTILKQEPGHLFGYIVEGTIARFRKDDAGLQRSYKAFLSHYDGEMKKGREEYKLHQTSLDDFRKNALAATGS